MNKFSIAHLKDFDYGTYWHGRGADIRKKLLSREVIFFDWIKPKSRVLDIACGSSHLPHDLKERKQCEVTVFDINRDMVEGQKALGIDGEVCDITDTNFALDAEFDYIIASETLEHFALPERVLEKLKKNTEYFVISVPNSAFYRFRMQLLFGGIFFRQWAEHPGEHLRYWSHADFLEWLEALGLSAEKAIASNGLDIGPLKLFKLWPNLFGHQMCYLVRTDLA